MPGQEKNRQLPLPFCMNEAFLREHIQKAVHQTVSLTITDNTSSILSVAAEGNTVRVRLQRIFLEAGQEVIDEIIGFIKKRKGSTPLLRRFVREHAASLESNAPRSVKISVQGRYYNLRDIYDTLNREYFNGRISCKISWGMKSARYAVKNRTLGSFDIQANLIRINPVLDRRNVPGYFITYIVYHEMLHADIGVENGTDKRTVHSREFKKRERLFKKYEKAVLWEKKNF